MRRLKDREVKELMREFARTQPSMNIPESARDFDEVVVGDNAVYFVDGVGLIIRIKGNLFPSLRFTKAIELLPHVVVDMGAIAHIVNGADVMRPGIKEIRSEFSKDDLVVIIDEKFGKPIALGFAELDSAKMKGVSRGKAIRSLHYVGDELWKNSTK